MKRVRVLKEMPFAKVGEQFETTKFGGGFNIVFEGTIWGDVQIEKLIKDGWLECVEDKSLEEKLDIDVSTNYTSNRTKLAQIATYHFKERFDKSEIASTIRVHSGWDIGEKECLRISDEIRKALFGEDNS